MNFTSAAIEKARQTVKNKNIVGTVLRIGIKGGGCNGMSYVLMLDNKISEKDKVFEFEELKIVVDPKSMLYLSGSTLDYEQGIMKQGFKFINPNEASKCACGTSFQTK